MEKPCGIIWCPLFDENRFPSDAQEILVENDYSFGEILQLRNLVGRVYCKGHRARGIIPKFSRCSEVLARVMRNTVQSKGNHRARLSAQLRRELDRIEQGKAVGLFEQSPF